MRASLLFAPGLSSCETVFRQPVSNQAAARTESVAFIVAPKNTARRETRSRSTYFIKARAPEAVWTLPHAADLAGGYSKVGTRSELANDPVFSAQSIDQPLLGLMDRKADG